MVCSNVFIIGLLELELELELELIELRKSFKRIAIPILFVCRKELELQFQFFCMSKMVGIAIPILLYVEKFLELQFQFFRISEQLELELELT